MSELKNNWSIILPNILTIILGILMYMIGFRLSSIIGGVVLNLSLLFKISRFVPWHKLNKREKANARYFWTINAIWPGFMFIAIISNLFYFQSALSLYVVVIGVVAIGIIVWYLTTSGISERYTSKVLENGGLLWRGKRD